MAAKTMTSKGEAVATPVDVEIEVTPLTEEEVQEELERAKAELEAIEEERKKVLEDIALSVTKKYTERAARRRVKDECMLKSLSYYLGSLATGESLTRESPFSVSPGKKRPDKNIIWTRCEIAKAQLISMQFSGDEKNWEVLPPHNAPADPYLVDQCEAMESVMADQMESCGYKREVSAAIHDMVVLGSGILKGPVNSGKLKKKYVPISGEDGSVTWVPQLTNDIQPEIKRVNPFMAFPDDSVTCFKDAEDFIEVHPMSRSEMQALKKNPAFSVFAEAISEIIAAGPSDLVSDSFQDFTSLTASNPHPYKNKWVVLEYHGPITSEQLETLEIDAPYDAVGNEYYGEIWVCNNKVIRVELENIEGCYKPPYSGDVWLEDPSSPFGFSLAEKLGDAQRVVTQTWHMILDNASASSAPQVVINDEMIDPRNGEFELKPGKIWYFTDISGDVKQAFQFFEVPNVTSQLFPILQFAASSAEEESGFSLSIGGLQSPQAVTDSATGIAMQQKVANVLLDQKSDSLDNNMIEPRIRALYDWNMQYNPDNSMKADMEIRIKSSTEYRNKEMYIRDMEKLSVESSNNPELAKHLEMNAVTRARISMMTLPSRSLVKSLDQVLAEEEQRQANQPPNVDLIKAEAEMKRVELEDKRLQLEAAKLEFEKAQNQQREAWEHEERTLNTYARVTEAQSELLRSQNDKETAMIQLAAKMKNEQEKQSLMANIAIMNEETKRYLASMQATVKAREQLLTEREQDIKLKTGSGI